MSGGQKIRKRKAKRLFRNKKKGKIYKIDISEEEKRLTDNDVDE